MDHNTRIYYSAITYIQSTNGKINHNLTYNFILNNLYTYKSFYENKLAQHTLLKCSEYIPSNRIIIPITTTTTTVAATTTTTTTQVVSTSTTTQMLFRMDINNTSFYKQPITFSSTNNVNGLWALQENITPISDGTWKTTGQSRNRYELKSFYSRNRFGEDKYFIKVRFYFDKNAGYIGIEKTPEIEPLNFGNGYLFVEKDIPATYWYKNSVLHHVQMNR
jgi:hypothetical protein